MRACNRPHIERIHLVTAQLGLAANPSLRGYLLLTTAVGNLGAITRSANLSNNGVIVDAIQAI